MQARTLPRALLLLLPHGPLPDPTNSSKCYIADGLAVWCPPYESLGGHVPHDAFSQEDILCCTLLCLRSISSLWLVLAVRAGRDRAIG